MKTNNVTIMSKTTLCISSYHIYMGESSNFENPELLKFKFKTHRMATKMDDLKLKLLIMFR